MNKRIMVWKATWLSSGGVLPYGWEHEGAPFNETTGILVPMFLYLWTTFVSQAWEKRVGEFVGVERKLMPYVPLLVEVGDARFNKV